MKIKFNEKQTTRAVYCIIVFAVCLLMTALVFKYHVILDFMNKLFTILAPVIWGVVIAYLLNPLVKFIEKQLGRFVFRKKKFPKLSRTIGITLAMVFLLGVITAILGSLVPEILGTLKNLFANMSSYLNNLQDMLNGIVNDTLEVNPQIHDYINSKFDSVEDMAKEIIAQYQPKLDNILAEDGIVADVTDSAWSFLTGLKNCLIGMVFSIYLLFSRDTLIAQARKITYALFPEKARVHIFSIASRSNSTFISFLSGKVIDSAIIGVLCFIGMMILGMRNYAVLISVFVGVTNIIPFFGPFIGAVPSALLILLTTPEKTIIFIIFVFLLQQFDGNVLGPKILGDSLGLPSFWTMFAIFAGGGLFGIIGMVAFIPLFAVFYSIFREIIVSKLETKKFPRSTDYYKEIDYSLPDSEHMIHEKEEEESENQEDTKADEKAETTQQEQAEEKTKAVKK